MREPLDASPKGGDVLPENKKWLFASAVIAIDGAIFDFVTPLGIASGVVYIVFIMTAFWWRSPRVPFFFAAIATFLIILGYIFIRQASVENSTIQINRALSILVVWVVALIVYYQKRTKITLQKSEETLRAIRDGTVDGIISINKRGTVESYNAACEAIFGYSADEVIGKNVKMLMPAPYQAEHDEYLLNFRKTGTKKIIGIGREVRGKRKDGSTLPIDLSVSEINANGERMYCGIVRDITERKLAEEEKERFIAKLAHSNKELDNFAYVASHDLKAPLRVISNVSNWIEEDLGENLDSDCQEHMDLLRNRVKRMERLLDDLLEYSRIGRQMESNDEALVNGYDLIQDTLLLADIPRGFTIKIGAGFSDIKLKNMPLKQIFSNLINNAVKHHDKDTGTICVDVETLDSQFAFTVSDDGPGIAPEFQEQVFRMFKTLKPRDQVEGSGMGLAMIEKHVNYFGQNISLTSSPGQGCCFRFTWPVVQVSPDATASEQQIISEQKIA